MQIAAAVAAVGGLWFYGTKDVGREEKKKACGYVVILYGVLMFIIGCGGLYSPVKALAYAAASSMGPAAACLTILFLYNGRETSRGERAGKAQKQFFYWYYPVHLLIIGLVKMAI